MTDRAHVPVARTPRLELREGVLLFDAAGRRMAQTADGRGPVDPPPRDLDDLAARFVHTDGTPVSLADRARQVALPRGSGPRVLIVSEPLAATDENAGRGTVVSILPFEDERDPETLLRALGSVLAHELRTPLTTVYAGSQLLARDDIAPAIRSDAARSVAGEADRLFRSVEDLVVLVRWAVDPAPEPEPVLLEPLLARVVERARKAGRPGASPDAEPPAIALHVEPALPAVAAAPGQLEHALRNLVDHAVANGPADRPVVVDAEQAGDRVEVSVRDAGPALDDAAAASAFALFARIGRPGGDPSGANLALVVARRLVERMGGTIGARSSPDGGDFRVYLPVFG